MLRRRAALPPVARAAEVGSTGVLAVVCSAFGFFVRYSASVRFYRLFQVRPAGVRRSLDFLTHADRVKSGITGFTDNEFRGRALTGISKRSKSGSLVKNEGSVSVTLK